ncbi:hypothetical protein DITRI_Ditri16bG0132600 [Diplodiscus trichospermus]
MALMLPLLSSLSSLTKLNLSECNLGEEVIPSDICSLSSLKELDLSGNDFIYLAATFNRLSKLRYLKLSNYRKLKSLPVLLSSIEKVIVHNCTSLEVVADPTTTSTSFYWAVIRGINTYKLTEKQCINDAKKALANARRYFY